MTRKESAQTIFNFIKSIGFKPYDIQYGNGYFIFDKGEDGVVHFKVNGLYGWKFGMWVNTNKNELNDKEEKEYPALQLFAQHKDNIDKFKPSRSYFLAEYCLEELENPAPYQWYQIKNMLKMIKRHPFISYYYDRREFAEFTGNSFILEYFKTKAYKTYETISDFISEWIPITWIKFKLFFGKFNKNVDKVVIVDMNYGGWVSTPRWEVQIQFSKDSTDKKENKWIKFWLNYYKLNYEHVRIELFRDGIEGSYGYTLK